jgi:hypothetical protein
MRANPELLETSSARASDLGRVGTVRLGDGTLVPFTSWASQFSLVAEQFWGRAVQAPCDLSESGRLFLSLPAPSIETVPEFMGRSPLRHRSRRSSPPEEPHSPAPAKTR